MEFKQKIGFAMDGSKYQTPKRKTIKKQREFCIRKQAAPFFIARKCFWGGNAQARQDWHLRSCLPHAQKYARQNWQALEPYKDLVQILGLLISCKICAPQFVIKER